ncbi:MAG TPA: PilZ domain-containing protein [Fibrobacteria bacterium]|nr:PilZ domain-containing protein [Fibrobacteria bacterium]
MNLRSFLLLASEDRRLLYEEVLAGLPVRAVATAFEAVKQCVSDPPLALLMDLATTLHAGVADTAPLYDLGIDLPILRCSGGEQGAFVAMCQAPFKREPLAIALDEIAHGDPTWKHPSNLRRYVRVSLGTRILFACAGTEDWKRGNAQSMSVSGLFVLSQETAAVGTDILLRILDCGDAEITVSASVAWVHRWEEGPHLPGFGLNFDPASVPDSLGHCLANSFFKRR